MFQRKPKNRGTEGNKKPKLICLSGFNALVFQKKCGLEELVKFSKNLTALGITFEIGVNDISWLAESSMKFDFLPGEKKRFCDEVGAGITFSVLAFSLASESLSKRHLL